VWVVTGAAYTAAGAATSALIGASLALLGGLMIPESLTTISVVVVLVLALIGIARDLGLTAFRLPRVRRQTQEVWGKYFTRPTAATLWGLDLGLTFTTRFAFSGISLLAVLPMAVGDPAFGAALLTTFWAGRATPVWIAPYLLQSPAKTPELIDEIDRERPLFRFTNLLALTSCASVLVISLLLATDLRP
jgi:hypothetical protein